MAIRAAAVGLMMGLERVVAFFAPNVATFLQGVGYGPDDLYRTYGLVLIVSALAVIGLHLVHRGQKDAMDDEADEAATLAQSRA